MGGKRLETIAQQAPPLPILGNFPFQRNKSDSSL
jgi:hypothetical protein